LGEKNKAQDELEELGYELQSRTKGRNILFLDRVSSN
jgi:hypothetical protein